MVKRAESAWRTPTRDFAQPDLGSRPEELRRRANPGETDPDRAGAVERRLEIERAPRNRELSTAWQTPRSTRSWEREPADPVEAVTGARTSWSVSAAAFTLSFHGNSKTPGKTREPHLRIAGGTQIRGIPPVALPAAASVRGLRY
jgi:hypothetical protein